MLSNQILLPLITFTIYGISITSHFKKIAIVSAIAFLSSITILGYIPLYLTGISVAICLLSNYMHNNKLDVLAIIMNITFFYLLQYHIFPEVNNTLMHKNIRIGPTSTLYNIWYNFDKPLITLLALGNFFTIHRKKTASNLQIMLLYIIGLASIIYLSIASDFIVQDFKISKYLLSWSLTNLIIVCITEEIFFRSYLFNEIEKIFGNNSFATFAAVITSSILFGLFHYHGSLLYVALAALSGTLYCLLYYFSGDIRISILGHFTLNLTHFIFFSYPMAK